MTYVVTSNCQRCRFTDCVVVCPVDCFHADDEMLYIDAEACIDCGACVPECPVDAIYPDSDVPESEKEWIAINADRGLRLPVIIDQEAPLETAEERARELGFG